MFDQIKPRRKLRLPQLAKYYRRMRRISQRSEFITMCEQIAFDEQIRRDRSERLRRDIEDQRARQHALAQRAAA